MRCRVGPVCHSERVEVMSSDGTRGDARTAWHVYLELARAREQIMQSGSCVWVVCATSREVEGATQCTPCHGSVSAFLVSGHWTAAGRAAPRARRGAAPAARRGGGRPARRARPGAPQRAALQPRVGGEQKRVIRRETSRDVNVRLAVIRKRVKQLAIYQHLDRNTCSSVAALLTVSSKSDSSSRGACSFCAHSASRAASACWSAPLVSCHEFSLRATTGAHFPRSTLVSAVLFWSKSNDRRARTCSVAVVSTVDAAPAVRRASARAGASCVAVCMPRARRVGGGTSTRPYVLLRGSAFSRVLTYLSSCGACVFSHQCRPLPCPPRSAPGMI